jgi:hypothetical protein
MLLFIGRFSGNHQFPSHSHLLLSLYLDSRIPMAWSSGQGFPLPHGTRHLHRAPMAVPLYAEEVQLPCWASHSNRNSEAALAPHAAAGLSVFRTSITKVRWRLARSIRVGHQPQRQRQWCGKMGIAVLLHLRQQSIVCMNPERSWTSRMLSLLRLLMMRKRIRRKKE